jgi:uncharacterized protein (DUF4415 family)
MTVSKENIVRRTLTPRREKTDAEWAAFDALTDAEIAAAVADDPDAAPLDLDWTKDIRIVEPPAKQAISIRIDGDVLAWFRANSDRYQSKINAVLRAYMEREKKSA